MSERDFYTFREYMRKDDELTASMEDYLEMIYRLSQTDGFTRIHDLAEALNVQPPSATKMVQKLADIDVVAYRKYGVVVLNEKGMKLGQALMARHQVVEDFLRIIGISENLLEETEKIEHTISPTTLTSLASLVEFFRARPSLLIELEKSLKK
ncbi:MAG: transcriptional regulator MntR [Candidatus Saccharibacteria bacterium]